MHVPSERIEKSFFDVCKVISSHEMTKLNSAFRRKYKCRSPCIDRDFHMINCFSVSLGTRIAVVVSNVLVLAVTWSKTAELYKEARQLKIKAPLATILLRDGATVNVFTILAV